MNTFQLIYDADTDRYLLDNEPLHCGDCIQVLVFNGLTGETEWIKTRLEMNGENEWYLVGLLGYQIAGLFARR